MTKLDPFNTDGVKERLSWEKPERKDQAGSLIIFGGASLKLKEVDSIFKSAKEYGIGEVSALVPESLSKVFKRQDPYLIPLLYDSHFGLSDHGLKIFQDEFALSDSLILADVGNSSSTQLKLAAQISKSFKPIVLTSSSFSLLQNFHQEILTNKHITIILNLQSLQKLIALTNHNHPILSSNPTNLKLKLLEEFSSNIESKIVLLDEGRILSVEDSMYLNIKQGISESTLSSHLVSWKIWAPASSSLEQLYMASLASE